MSDINSLDEEDFPDSVSVGQLWSISWNKSHEKLIVIKKLFDVGFLACPVTCDKYFPGIGSPELKNNYVLPNLEFFYSYPLLDRYFGSIFPPVYFNKLACSKTEEELESIYNTSQDSKFLYTLNRSEPDFDSLEKIIDSYSSIKEERSFSYLREGIARKLRLENFLLENNISRRDSYLFASGEKPLDLEVFKKISINYGLDEANLVSEYKDPYEMEISSPWWKGAIIQLMEKMNISETEVRANLYNRICSPARSSSSEISEKLQSVIDELLDG